MTDNVVLLFQLMLMAAGALATCPWHYGCSVGYCRNTSQVADSCTCTNCTCLSDCLTGPTCSLVVNSTSCDWCIKEPCPAGFSCVKGFNKRSCQCNVGRTGHNCELTVGSVCESYPCFNGGTCKETSATSYLCECPSDLSGAQCTTPRDICGNVDCGSRGTCLPIFNSSVASCSCAPTWQSPSCDQSTLERSLSSDSPKCYQVHSTMNSTSVTTTSSRLMTIDECRRIFDTDSSYMFFLLAGQLCLCGSDVSVLSSTSSSGRCNKPCPGNLFQSCGDEENGLVYLFKNQEMPNACQVDYPRCNEHKYQGHCIRQREGYSCLCAPGFTSSECDKEIDMCSSMGCLNGASCVESADHLSAKCQCLGGFSGPKCGNESGCFRQPCRNGGICTDTDTSGGFACSCEAAFTDVVCGTYMACESSPCSNGQCVNVDSGVYRCDCWAGYQGENCDIDINECLYAEVNNATVCENFGTCRNTIGSYYCSCINGTEGFNCSINPDDCEIHNVTYEGAVFKNLCKARDPAGNCTDGYATYTCTCSAHWTGEYCLDDINECLEWTPPPCENFATCTHEPGNYSCECIQGTYGRNCSINPDDCLTAAQPCNATDVMANCTDGFASYTCQCGPDYTGQYCDMSIIIYNILQKLGGESESEADLINLMTQLLANPSMTKDIIPFVVGMLPPANQTALSWTPSDMFLWAAYEEKALDTSVDLYQWTDVVLGNCFTFNHFNNTARQYLMRSAGAQGSLQAALKLNSDEYTPWIDTNAIMVFIHPNTETIFSESPRYNCEPGTDATIETKQSNYQRLGGRYGKCIKSPSEVAYYYYEGAYTVDGCSHSCYQVQVQKACNCMDSRYPVPEGATLCQLKDVNCVNDVVAKGDVSTWAGCVCPTPCDSTQFDSSFTQAPFVINTNKCNQYTAAQRANDLACSMNNLTAQPDYVLVSVRVPSLTINTFKETPAMTFNTVIGNIGGLGGVVCGINLITFFEFGFYFFVQLPMTLIYNRAIN